jgi:hypothetical protein
MSIMPVSEHLLLNTAEPLYILLLLAAQHVRQLVFTTRKIPQLAVACPCGGDGNGLSIQTLTLSGRRADTYTYLVVSSVVLGQCLN